MRRVGRRGSLLWLVAAGLILLWPTPVDRPVDGTLLELLRALHRAGLPHWIDYFTVEFTANVLLFAPLGVFLVLTTVRRIGGWSALSAIAVGLAVSLAAELAQALLLPARFASASDVAANTLGAALGAVITTLAVRRSR